MPRRVAFTLIELLVVIAIIALILAILLPSLSGARQQSQSTLCLSRLRSLGQGWHMYADDNDDMTVPGKMANAGGGTANPANWYEVGNGLRFRPPWAATMGRYVGLYAYSAPRTDVERQDYDDPTYFCPTVASWVGDRNAAYGYNYQFLGNARRTAGQFHNFPVNRSRLASFGGTLLAADSMGTAAGSLPSDRLPYDKNGSNYASWGNHGWSLDPPRLTAQSDRGSGDADSPRTAVDPRHLQKVNAVFCDGHGETFLPQKVGYRIGDDGVFQQGLEGGDRPSNYYFSGTGRDDDPPAKPN